MTKEPRNPGGPVVIGLDDSPGGRAALRFALEEGVARGVAVEVVTTWLLDTVIRDRITDQMIEDEGRIVAMMQDQILAEVARDLPAMPQVSRLVLHDAGGAPLVETAKNACMLVVGSGRKGPLARTFLGSVSEYCVRHSRVPVVVVADPALVPESAHDATLASVH